MRLINAAPDNHVESLRNLSTGGRACRGSQGVAVPRGLNLTLGALLAAARPDPPSLKIVAARQPNLVIQDLLYTVRFRLIGQFKNQHSEIPPQLGRFDNISGSFSSRNGWI